jgi:hypothetical protein
MMRRFSIEKLSEFLGRLAMFPAVARQACRQNVLDLVSTAPRERKRVILG